MCAMMDDMQPHGRMSTKMGFSVTMVLDWSAWWSMTPTMLPIGIALFSCDCCWKSTRHTERSGASLSRSSTGGGRVRPQCSSANSVSVLISLARAGTPPYRFAAPIAPAMESRSVTMCPQKIASLSSGKNVVVWPVFLGRCVRRSLPSSQCSSTACSSGVSSRSPYVSVCRCFMAGMIPERRARVRQEYRLPTCRTKSNKKCGSERTRAVREILIHHRIELYDSSEKIVEEMGFQR